MLHSLAVKRTFLRFTERERLHILNRIDEDDVISFQKKGFGTGVPNYIRRDLEKNTFFQGINEETCDQAVHDAEKY